MVNKSETDAKPSAEIACLIFAEVRRRKRKQSLLNSKFRIVNKSIWNKRRK